MRRFEYMLLASVITVSSTGCGVLRGIEQWKCDHFGLCHGVGSTPAAAPPPAYLPPTYPPSYPSGGGECCNRPPMMNNPVSPPPANYGGPAFDPYVP